MNQENFDKDFVSTSKLYMMRCLIAIAHADGIFCDADRDYIKTMMARLPLVKEQQETLEQDFETPQDVGTLLRHINEPRFRGQVVYFARLMAYKDGTLSPSEADIINHLHLKATEGLDMDGIRADARQAAAAKLAAHDIEIAKNRPRSDQGVTPYFSWLDQFMLWLGIDLMK